MSTHTIVEIRTSTFILTYRTEEVVGILRSDIRQRAQNAVSNVPVNHVHFSDARPTRTMASQDVQARRSATRGRGEETDHSIRQAHSWDAQDGHIIPAEHSDDVPDAAIHLRPAEAEHLANMLVPQFSQTGQYIMRE